MIVLEPSRETLVTTREAAEMAGVTEARIYQLLASGEMRGIKVNQKAWLIPVSEVKQFAERPATVGRPRSGRNKMPK